MIKKMYGTTVLVEEINTLVSESLWNILKQRTSISSATLSQNMRPLFRPDKSDEFNFTSSWTGTGFEVAPSKNELTRYLIEPDAKMIADYVDN